MSTPSSPPDSALFIISPDQKAKYDAQFNKFLPGSGGLITGEQAKGIMLKSGLPPAILAHIWELSDVDKDGKMDHNEFSIAMHLIALNLKGVPVPRTLPPSLKLLVEPPPFEAFDNKQTPTTAARPPLSTSNSISPTVSMNKMSGSLNNSMNNISSHAGGPTPSKPAAAAGEWPIPQNSKLKYTQLFNTHDRQRTGFLTGQQARTILLESKLPQGVLAQIWNLSDVDADGKLMVEEFVLAMHLIDKAKNNEILPTKLPPEYVPPSFRRSSTGGAATGGLSHTSSIDEPAGDGMDLHKHSFEDKRRENFEKGQAELDRRRAALMEQQRREKEERERKEREENARKERERLEAERKKQEELERQQQRLREAELEKEEAKRRAQEVKDLARKEMERQRQNELEQARRNELLAQRARLVEEIQKFKSRRKQVLLEHEKVDKGLNEAKTNVALQREKVVRAKAEIDDMRIKRDQKLAKHAQVAANMKMITERQLFIEQEKVRLSAQLKTLMANASNGVGGEQQQLSSYISMLQSKQLMINQLKSQVERLRQEIETKKSDMTSGKTELQQLKQKFSDQRKEAKSFGEQIEQKRQEAEQARDANVTIDNVWEVPSNVQWNNAADATSSSAAAASSAADAFPAATTVTQTKFKYKCLFEFEARNADEITIKPGDIVMVDTSACSEPDWLSGEINGKVGWFPKEYVELVDEAAAAGGAAAAATAVADEVVPAAGAAAATEHPASYSPALEAKQALALYDYSAAEEGHITFAKDDLIRVTQEHEDWYYGEKVDATGNVISFGWFVASYVKMLDDTAATAAPATAAAAGTTTTASTDQASDEQQQYYTSLYQFDSIEPGDLSFNVDELIFVEKKESDWWTGVVVDRLTGEFSATRRGVFPSNYVGPAAAQDIPAKKTESAAKPAENVAAAAATATPEKKVLSRVSSNTSISDSSKPNKMKKKKLEIVQVIAPYTATGAEQLSLEVGQLIQVRKKNETGWWEGELQAKGKKKQVGWFPASFVKSLAGGSTASSGKNTPVPDSSSSGKDEPEIERVMGLYSFKATRPEEMDFEPNDVIRVLSKPDPTWWRGHNTRTDTVGLFPFNHVQVMGANGNGNYYDQVPTDDDDEDETNNMARTQTDDSLENHHEHYGDGGGGGGGGQEDEDAFSSDSFLSDESDDDWSGGDQASVTSNTTTAATTSPQLYNVRVTEVPNNRASINYIEQDQINRQRLYAIYELIDTEDTYVKDIFFTLENFKDTLCKVVPREEIEKIFSNLDEIYLINNRFYSEFYERHAANTDPGEYIICDLILAYLREMLPSYKMFCSSQQSVGSRHLQQKLESDEHFAETLKSIKSAFQLSAYLLKPVQRITKYPLLIEKIFEATPPNHPDYDNCAQCLAFAKQFCKEINDACKQSENFDRLSWLQKHVQLDAKLVDYQIDFNSETQSLGPRQLLHAGIIYKATSAKLVVAFLFNDFLMLTLPNKKITSNPKSGAATASRFFYNDKAMNCSYKLYRKPFLMNDIKLDETTNRFENSVDPTIFRLQIKSLKRNMSFKAGSSNDCLLWVRKIREAKQDYENIINIQKNHRISRPPTKKKVAELYLTIVEAVQLFTRNHVLNAFCRAAIGGGGGGDWSDIEASFETDTKRVVVEAKERTHSLRRSKSSVQDDHLCKVTFESSYKFSLSNLDDCRLLFRCFERSSFAPPSLLGETTLSIASLVERSRGVHGPVLKNIALTIPKLELNKSLMISRTKPSLLIRYHIVKRS